MKSIVPSHQHTTGLRAGRKSAPALTPETSSILSEPTLPSDRSQLSLDDPDSLKQSRPRASRQTLFAIMGALGMLGLTGLGLFQGSAAQASVPPPETQIETVVTSDSLTTLTPMTVTPEMHVAGRQGQLLGPGKILKFDQFPGLHREHLSEQVPGAPNFRQVPGTDVHGVAQPTIDGIRNVLDRVNGKERPVVWTNMREEPVVYINGRSYSLREEAHPFENSDDFEGAQSDSVARTEQQLKAEILAEAEANDGKVLLHDETADGVVSKWVSVAPGSVQTTHEVYQQFQEEGYQVDFARVPVTDEKTPEHADLQALVGRVSGAEDSAALIFNCHAGRGRTTTAMVAAQLLQRAQNPEITNGQAFHRLDSVRQDMREQGHYEQGNYRLILSLVQHLDNGLNTKSETDQVLDGTEHIQNLRTDINKYRERSLRADNPDSAKKAESKGLDYLHRYHTLITFNQYVKEQAPNDFQMTFSEWLETKPELTEMLKSFELAVNQSAQPGHTETQYA